MHLVSLVEQTLQLNGTTFFFGQGEPIVTEHSYKYSADGVRQPRGALGMGRQKALDGRRKPVQRAVSRGRMIELESVSKKFGAAIALHETNL